MYLLYSLLFSLAFMLSLPYFIVQALRHGKYAGSVRERLGWLPVGIDPAESPVLWIHAVSVGELLAAVPLIKMIRAELPRFSIVVSTTTLTGQELARARLLELPHGPTGILGVFYFPFDWKFSVRRALGHINPSAVVIMETELWPNFLNECRKRSIPTVIANGRISERSFKRYGLARAFIRRAMNDLSLLVMQTDRDAERVRALGASADRVIVCGNLKYDATNGPQARDCDAVGDRDGVARDYGAHGANGVRPDSISKDAFDNDPRGEELDRQFGLASCSHLIVAGSTAAGEEEMLLEALSRVRTRPGLEDTRLLIAPRHPERFEAVAELIAGSQTSLARRSTNTPEGSTKGSGGSMSHRAVVVLLDTIGELALAYRFATVVFVGGSLVPRGGHNIIEAAVHGKPIVVGPYTDNFRQIIADFEQLAAVSRISAGGASELKANLVAELTRLLVDRQAAEEMGARARSMLEKNQGATKCTVARIKELVR